MGLTIYWTQFAQNKLEDIFEYYKFKTGIRVAQVLIDGIVNSSLTLEFNAFGGQKEELLSDRIQDFRYLVFKNYKIIYWIMKPEIPFLYRTFLILGKILKNLN